MGLSVLDLIGVPSRPGLNHQFPMTACALGVSSKNSSNSGRSFSNNSVTSVLRS